VQASSRPRIARARHIYLPTLTIQYPEHVPAAKLYTFEIVPSPIDEASSRLTIEDLLQPSLCEAVCAVGFSRPQQS